MQLLNNLRDSFNESDDRRKVIFVVLVLGVVILFVVYILFTFRVIKRGEEPGRYYDPGSGETVSDPPGKSPETADIGVNDRPIFLGFSKLLDHGMSTDQVNGVQEGFYQYSQTLEKPLKEVSLTVKSIDPVYPNPDSGDTAVKINFEVTLDRKNVYKARVEYDDITTVRLFLSDTKNKQVFASGVIDMTNPDTYD
jgi:hypothetical protein